MVENFKMLSFSNR